MLDSHYGVLFSLFGCGNCSTHHQGNRTRALWFQSNLTDFDINTEQRLIRLTHPLLNIMCSSIISTLLLNLGYQIWEEKLNRSKGIKIDRKNSNKIDNTLMSFQQIQTIQRFITKWTIRLSKPKFDCEKQWFIFVIRNVERMLRQLETDLVRLLPMSSGSSGST
jgi:hypothetical protein